MASPLVSDQGLHVVEASRFTWMRQERGAFLAGHSDLCSEAQAAEDRSRGVAEECGSGSLSACCVPEALRGSLRDPEPRGPDVEQQQGWTGGQVSAGAVAEEEPVRVGGSEDRRRTGKCRSGAGRWPAGHWGKHGLGARHADGEEAGHS